MNPLPFFPPPARAFSHANNNTRQEPRGRSKSGSSSYSLRHTLSLTGSAANSTSRSRVVSAGGTNSPADVPKSTPTSRPGTGHHTPEASSTDGDDGGSIRRTATSLSPALASSLSSMQNITSLSSTPSSGSASTKSASSNNGAPSPTPEILPSASSSAPAAAGQQSSNQTQQGPSNPSPSSSILNLKKPSRSSTLPVLATPSGRTGANLPKGLTFDWIRSSEVAQCYLLEKASYEPDDAATKDRMAYRQKNAPHLFLGAYVPGPPPKVAGPLSVGLSSTPRKLIGFINATASSSLSARAIKQHTVSNADEGVEAWLICLHSIVVDESFRHRGLGLRMLEEYMMRLRRAEEGRGEVRKGDLERPKGYECVALLSHEETLPFFLKAGFGIVGPSHVRSGSGEWIELRRYIQHSHQKIADEKRKQQDEELELQKQLRRVASVTAAASQSSRQQAQSSRPPAPSSSSKTSSMSSAASASPNQNSSQQTSSLQLTMQQPQGEQSWQMTASPTSSEGPGTATVMPTRQTDTTSRQASGSGAGGALGGFSQADLLAALSASTPSFKPGENPSKPFSTILGQTLAGKTFVEDAFLALEARLVDRGKSSTSSSSAGDSDSQGTNLMEIWCPREECGCKLVPRATAMWELAESGPLSQPELAQLHLPSNSASLPPIPQPPPAPASHIRALKERKDGSSIRSTLPGAPPSAQCLTPIRPFWSLCSAMSFDNIGFSKDVEWKLPTDAGAGGGGQGGNAGGGEDDDHSQETSSSTAHGSTKKKKPVTPSVRRPTFRNTSGGGGGGGGSGGGSGRTNSSRPMSPPNRGHSPPALPGSPRPAKDDVDGGASSAQAHSNAAAPRVTVKYLLCPNCDTGPLGYTIVPEKLTGGKMGLEVGEELGKEQRATQAQGGGAGGAGRTTPPVRDIQIFLLAAERVRYRAVK